MARPRTRHVAALLGGLVLAVAGCDSGANLQGSTFGAEPQSPSAPESEPESGPESEPGDGDGNGGGSSPEESASEETTPAPEETETPEETEPEDDSGGSGVDACYDGTCEVTAGEGTEIPLDPDLGLGMETLSIADVGGGLVTLAQDFGYVQTGPGGTGTLNGLNFEILDIAGDEVTLRLFL